MAVHDSSILMTKTDPHSEIFNINPNIAEARFWNIRWSGLGEIDYIHILAKKDTKESFSHKQTI